MNNKKKNITEVKSKKTDSYPSIYTYISQMEDFDIKRLVTEFSNFKRKKKKLPQRAKALKIVNGKLEIIPAEIVITPSETKLTVKRKTSTRKKTSKKISTKDLQKITDSSI